MDEKNTGSIAVSDPFDSVTAFYIHYKRLLFQEAWKYLPQLEDVEDVVCETLTRLLENAGKFHAMESSHQIQYAKVIVRNLCYHHLRRSSYFTMVPFEDIDVYFPIAERDDPEHLADRKLRTMQIRKVWVDVPPEDRLLLEQKYILGWSDETIASGLGIKAQSVRMSLTRAKRRTAKLMQDAGIRIDDWF